MRGWLSIVALLLVLAVVGFLLKRQTAALVTPGPARSSPAPNQPQPQGGPAQLQQQYRQALEQAIQQPRLMPDDVK